MIDYVLVCVVILAISYVIVGVLDIVRDWYSNRKFIKICEAHDEQYNAPMQYTLHVVEEKFLGGISIEETQKILKKYRPEVFI